MKPLCYVWWLVCAVPYWIFTGRHPHHFLIGSLTFAVIYFPIALLAPRWLGLLALQGGGGK
jgi:hypothetical protein